MSDMNHSSLYDNSEYPSRKREPDTAPRPRKSKMRRRPFFTFLKVFLTLLLVGLCTGVILCCFGAMYIKSVIIPQADLSLDDYVLGENSVMYYTDKATGEEKELCTLMTTTSSIWVDYEDIPQDLKDAAVAIEDKRFWDHPGIDWRRTLNAVKDMFTGNDISGGSTITQQMIKNLTDYNETTVKRKLVEIVRALRFTQNNSKEDTLTMYLNIIPLGASCEGVGSAAYAYFGKDVSELSLAECASLIGITNNPSKYGPYSEARSATETTGEVWNARQWNKWRQENILYQMLDQGYITQSEYDAAVAEELVFVRGENNDAPKDIYSWYEETVIADVKKDLIEKYGLSDERAGQLLSSGGLRIYTCVDLELQKIVEEVYSNRDNLPYTSARGQKMQSSITVIDNATGDVVAIAGQFGEKEGNLLDNFANSGARQPGSSIKPLSVYSPAVEMGLISSISIVDDYPLYLKADGQPWPYNSGSTKYRGLTTIKDALTRSVNTIAVRLVQDMVTPAESFKFVEERYHIDLVDKLAVGSQIKSDRDTSPLALGGLTRGVNTRDMAEAYATFPNNGVYTESRTYTRVEDSEGNIILEKAPVKETVIKDTTAYYMNDMLTNVVVAGTGTGARLSNMTAAGKTGTTSENYDRWFVGYTPYYTAAVWTGYAQNEKITQSNPAVPLWQNVMGKIHAGLSNQSFPTPNGLVKVDSYCLDSGLLATEYCQLDPRGSRVASATIHQDDVPTDVCTIHTAESVVKLCKDCPILDADGKETGLYHLAGEACPAESIWEVCLPNYERAMLDGIYANDEKYLLRDVTSFGTCTVHEFVADPGPDPNNPLAPWFPDYDPENPFPWFPSIGGDEPAEEPPSQDIPSQDIFHW